MSDAIEFFGYLSFFWLFVFSRRFRELQAAEWQRGGFLNRGEMIIQAVTSAILGLGSLYAIASFALSR